MTCTKVSGKNYSNDEDRVPNRHYTASKICDITSEKTKFFTVKSVKTLNHSSYNLINNRLPPLLWCQYWEFFHIFTLVQYTSYITLEHSKPCALLWFNILHTSHSNMQNPVHYCGLIRFIFQTQTRTVLCITSCSYPRTQDKKPKFSNTQTEQIENNIYNLTVSTRKIPLWLLRVRCVFIPSAFFQETCIQHLAISLTLLQGCQDSLFADVLPRQCPPSPSKHWYCCLWGVMDLVWLSSVHACFLNSITNLFAISVSFQRSHAQKSHNKEVYMILVGTTVLSSYIKKS